MLLYQLHVIFCRKNINKYITYIKESAIIIIIWRKIIENKALQIKKVLHIYYIIVQQRTQAKECNYIT